MTTLPPPPARAFASDNAAGAHPAVIEAVLAANVGSALAYGDDEYTRECAARFRDLFGADVTTRLVFNGTGANIVALATLLGSLPGPNHAVVCTDWAHIAVDETGAPERALATKLIDLPATRRQVGARAARGARPRPGSPAPRATRRGVDHPGHRARHAVHRRRDRCALRPGARPRDAGAPRWRPHRQRHRRARRHPWGVAGDDDRRRRRCGELRGHQERPAGSRSGRLPLPRRGRGLAVRPQAGHPAAVQDALPGRAVQRGPARRPVDRPRIARQRDGHRTAPADLGDRRGRARRSPGGQQHLPASAAPTSSAHFATGASSGTGMSASTRSGG